MKVRDSFSMHFPGIGNTVFYTAKKNPFFFLNSVAIAWLRNVGKMKVYFYSALGLKDTGNQKNH